MLASRRVNKALTFGLSHVDFILFSFIWLSYHWLSCCSITTGNGRTWSYTYYLPNYVRSRASGASKNNWLLAAFAKEAIRYEEVTFDPSGFWGDDSLGTPYEGGPTPEIDIKWNHLVRGKKISDPKYLMSRIIDFLVKLACIRSPRKNMTSWTLRQVLFRVRRMNT